jgi:hypothetical protein
MRPIHVYMFGASECLASSALITIWIYWQESLVFLLRTGTPHFLRFSWYITHTVMPPAAPQETVGEAGTAAWTDWYQLVDLTTELPLPQKSLGLNVTRTNKCLHVHFSRVPPPPPKKQNKKKQSYSTELCLYNLWPKWYRIILKI